MNSSRFQTALYENYELGWVPMIKKKRATWHSWHKNGTTHPKKFRLQKPWDISQTACLSGGLMGDTVFGTTFPFFASLFLYRLLIFKLFVTSWNPPERLLKRGTRFWSLNLACDIRGRGSGPAEVWCLRVSTIRWLKILGFPPPPATFFTLRWYYFFSSTEANATVSIRWSEVSVVGALR